MNKQLSNPGREPDNYQIASALMSWIQKFIKYDHYPNFTRDIKAILKDKRANCVDMANMLARLLYCKYKIKVRFRYAKVIVQMNEDRHIWVQAKLKDPKTGLEAWIDLDPTSKTHKPGDTYEITDDIGTYKSLAMFGVPKVKKGCDYGR